MRKWLLALFVSIITVSMMAVGGSVRHVSSITKGAFPIAVRDTITADDDSLFAVTPDSVYLKPLDSLRVAALADPLEADTAKKKSEGLDQPVKYTARDSMTYNALSHDISLYGNSEVSYQDMNLTADIITMNTDSSLVHAT